MDTHTLEGEEEREGEREREALSIQRDRITKRSVFFPRNVEGEKRRKKRVSFAVKTFVVELNIWMPQAK